MALSGIRKPVLLGKALILAIAFLAFLFQSCKHENKVYRSDCDMGITFKRIGFTQLIDSIQNYDQQYVEIEGVYMEGRDQSALFNDRSFSDHSLGHAIWINFSQDCPLYLLGTHIGLFEYNDGKFTQLNNRPLKVRGKIDASHKGHSGSYRASLERVSLVEL